MRKKIFLLLAALAAVLLLYGMFRSKPSAPENNPVDSATEETAEAPADVATEPATETAQDEAEPTISADYTDAIDMNKWHYNADDGVYYQLGITYCKNPADSKYEQLALFVPQAFMKCQKNGKDTYSCTPSNDASVNIFNSKYAPYVIPLESPQYAANPALTEYRSFKKFTDAGLIYTHVGFRGREHGAPAGLVDLKAAIRYLRHNKKLLAGNTDYIFPFGTDGGGGLAILLGTSGNNAQFKPYLRAIGAIDGGSDKVYGVMAWNSLTNFDSADEAYEWNMGMTRQKMSDSTKQLSEKMAREYANYINNSGFLSEDRTPLILQYSSRGIFQEGIYYDIMKIIIGNSLSVYLENTNFPHRVSEKETADFKGELNMAGYYIDKVKYLKALNEKHNWIQYHFAGQMAGIRTIEDLVRSFRPATENIPAFDAFDRSSPINILFGDGQGHGYHSDATMAKILKNTPQAQEYLADLRKQDDFGNSVQQRLNMYTPLYYIMSSYDGFRTGLVAPFWRINLGINHTATALTNDINIALALKQYPSVAQVNYRMVWNAGAGKVEDLGKDGDDAFIKWVSGVMSFYYEWDLNK